jgi:hypothetical protein
MEHMKFVGGYPNEDCIYPEDLSMDEKRDTPTIEVTIYLRLIRFGFPRRSIEGSGSNGR